MKHGFLTLLYRVYSLQWILKRPVTLGVRALLVREGRVLLVRHWYQNDWFLPGGGVKRKETPEQAARRECREETGAEVGDLALFGIYTQYVEHKNDHIVVFIGEDFRIVGEKDFEIEAVDFFKLDALPPDMNPGSRRRIEEYLRGEHRPVATYW